jgi:hypothetical protein
VNAADPPTFPLGKYNQSVDFNNAQTVRYATFPALPTITVAAWVKISPVISPTLTSNRSLFHYSVNGIAECDFGFTSDSYLYARTALGNGRTSLSKAGEPVLSSGWNFVAFQYSPNNFVRYKVNNSTWIQGNASAAITNSAHLLQIGRGGFDGQIDELAVWNRILTESELNKFANNPQSAQICFPTPTATPTLTRTPTPTRPIRVYNIYVTNSTTPYQNLDLFTYSKNYNTTIGKWDGVSPDILNIYINSGATIISDSTDKAALYIQNFPSSASINLINNGTIVGASGAGGTAGTGTNNGGNGENGGNAIHALEFFNFTNKGRIYAGCGGGGGGGGYLNNLGGVGGLGYGGFNNKINTITTGKNGAGPTPTKEALFQALAGVDGGDSTATKKISDIIAKYGATRIRYIHGGCGGGGQGNPKPAASVSFGGDYKVTVDPRYGSGIAFTNVYYDGSKLIGDIRILSNGYVTPGSQGANSFTQSDQGAEKASTSKIDYEDVDLTNATITLRADSNRTFTAQSIIWVGFGSNSGKGGSGGSWLTGKNGSGTKGFNGTDTRGGIGGSAGLWINSTSYILNPKNYNSNIIKDKNNF